MNDAFDQTGAGPAVAEVDRLLSEFYQAELPDPWPRLCLPRAMTFRRPVRRQSHSLFRLGLAASVVVALLSYWALAGLFAGKGGIGSPLSGPEIGKKLPSIRPAQPEKCPPQMEDGPRPMPLIGPSDNKGMR
jgi:hypothetical protein